MDIYKEDWQTKDTLYFDNGPWTNTLLLGFCSIAVRLGQVFGKKIYCFFGAFTIYHFNILFIGCTLPNTRKCNSIQSIIE